MTWLSRLAAPLLAALFCCAAFAQNGSQEPAPTTATLRARLDKMPRTVEVSDVNALVAQINALAAATDKLIAARTVELNDLDARLGQLGAAPADGAAAESADITQRRAALTRERGAVDTDIRLARLIVVDAQQRANELLVKRRARLEAQITERAASPLGREFWDDLSDVWPADVERLRLLGADVGAGLKAARQPGHATALIAALILALLAALPGNWLAERALTRLVARAMPAGRLRRSLLVIAIVAANVLLAGLAAQGVHAVFERHGVWTDSTRELGRVMVQSVVFIAFVAGLGRALLSNKRPSWRLPPISDAIAARLAPFPWLMALITILVWLPTRINDVVDASFAAVAAMHVITALALTGLFGAMLLRLRGPRAAAAESSESAGEPKHSLWLGALMGGVAVILALICILVATGYVAMASFLASQLNWSTLVLAAFYVLFRFENDFFIAVMSSRGSLGHWLQTSFGLAPRTLDQTSVVLSGLTRITLFFYLIMALAAPLGSSPGEVFQRGGKFGVGLRIGQLQLVPGAIFSAAAVLIAGFVVLRIFKHWLDRRYLPTTALAPGMQSSIATLLGYVGGIVVISFALSALGIGIERIAWVASALSVGIGFGLQAIVQNFISGLILLAEQPVKVGDWVVLGNAEGDIRRINVRATEIQLSDRSTMVVPNSEFITKTVRNMTLANAQGRVLIRLPMPLTTDATRARMVILAALGSHPGVLPSPAPSVTLEGVEVGFLIFQAVAYVQSPRMVAAVRSDLLFAILDGLREAELPMAAWPGPPPAGAAAP
jgi:small-conductance mechanosensitive channel